MGTTTTAEVETTTPEVETTTTSEVETTTVEVETTTTAAVETTTVEVETTTTAEVETTTAEVETTTRVTVDVVCYESEDGMTVFIPHPSDCGLYYVCVGLNPVLMSCPGGLFFDPSLNVCNWPELVDCD